MNDTTTLEVLADKPQELTRRASDVAGLCRDIVLKTAVNIQGRKYVKVEGWQSIATAHGCVASCRDVEKVTGGFRAIGEIRRIADGQCLATAEGFVGEDEPTWFGGQSSNGKTLPKRADYAIRAMAQTRAISRVCRSCFAHVVVLMDAGLSTTPAEEVPDGGFNDSEPLRHVQHVKTPSAASQTPRRAIAASKDNDADASAGTQQRQDATDDQRARMVKLLEPMRQAATQMFIELAWLLPTETLEDTPLSRVPTTKGAMDRLMAEVQAFVDGVPRQTKSDDEWWREIIVPVPHAGQKRDEYLKNPDTIGGLYDACDSDEEARRRLFGFVGHYQPKSWTKKDGTEMPPSDADIRFREALDAFNDWREKRRVTEAD